MTLLNESGFYFLEEAFNLLGQHLYASQWDGQEIVAQPCPGPDESEERSVALARQLTALSAEIGALDKAIAKTVNASEIQRLKAERDALAKERQGVALEHDAFPDIGDLERARYTRWQRRETALRVLTDAFKSDALPVWSSRGPSMTRITSDLWRGEHRGFAWYLDLSLAVLPRTISGMRRGVIKIRSADFLNWQNTVPPIASEALADLPLEDQATLWFRTFVSDHKGTPPKRDSAIWEMRKEFSGLSEAAGKRIWTANAPVAWKRPGPRSA